MIYYVTLSTLDILLRRSHSSVYKLSENDYMTVMGLINLWSQKRVSRTLEFRVGLTLRGVSAGSYTISEHNFNFVSTLILIWEKQGRVKEMRVLNQKYDFFFNCSIIERG